MSDWRDAVGHDFSADDFVAMEREGERLVMEARTLAEIRKIDVSRHSSGGDDSRHGRQGLILRPTANPWDQLSLTSSLPPAR